MLVWGVGGTLAASAGLLLVNACVGCRWYFGCQRWLATNEDDGQIARELVAMDKSKLAGKDASRLKDELLLENKGRLSFSPRYFFPMMDHCQRAGIPRASHGKAHKIFLVLQKNTENLR